MRNPKGFGSIYKMNDRPRRKKYRVVVTIKKYDGFTSVTKRVTIGCYRTKKEAFQALLDYNSKKSAYNNESMKLIAVIRRWEQTHFLTVSERTRKNIISQINKFSSLHNLNIGEIKMSHLQSFFDDLPVSTGTKKSYRSLLNSIFNYALKYELVEKNIISLVDIGLHKKVRHPLTFSKNEIALLWRKKSAENVDIILILIYTGLRINELLNLRKSNVKLKNRYIIAGSKTNYGKDRLIPLHKNILPLIENRIMYSKNYLIEQDNKKIKYAAFRRDFLKLMKFLKFKKHSLHDTRHTFATIINNAGANTTSIKTIIGHSDFKLTEKVYTHKDIIELKKAIDKIKVNE